VCDEAEHAISFNVRPIIRRWECIVELSCVSDVCFSSLKASGLGASFLGSLQASKNIK
jgi:hypothetical protein